MTRPREIPRFPAILILAGASSAWSCSLHLDEIDRELKAKSAVEAGAGFDGAGGKSSGDARVLDAGSSDHQIEANTDGVRDADASLVEQDVSAPASDAVADAAVIDAPAPAVDAARCSSDSDCPVNRGQCQASLCKSGVCTGLGAYQLVASQFNVAPAPRTRLGGHRNGLIAAVDPYLFVLNAAAGVSVFNVSNPRSTAPRPVAIEGLPAKPLAAVIAVGTVVYFVGQSATAESGAQQPLSWIDLRFPAAVSADGTVLHAQVPLPVFIEPPLMPLQQPTKIDSLFNVLPSQPDGVFLSYFSSDHPTYYPTALLTKPGTKVTAVPYWNQALVTGANLVAASGSRLVAYTSDGPQAKFALVTMPGTSASNVGSQITVPTMAAAQAAFASSDEGGVLWTSALLTKMPSQGTLAPQGPIATVRLTLLLADRNTATLSAIAKVDPSTYVDLERYAMPVAEGEVVVAPPVWISSTLALGLAANHTQTTTETLAQVISVNVSAGTLLAKTDAAVLAASSSTIDVASSNGLAYVLGAGASSDTVYVLAPACAGN